MTLLGPWAYFSAAACVSRFLPITCECPFSIDLTSVNAWCVVYMQTEIKSFTTNGWNGRAALLRLSKYMNRRKGKRFPISFDSWCFIKQPRLGFFCCLDGKSSLEKESRKCQKAADKIKDTNNLDQRKWWSIINTYNLSNIPTASFKSQIATKHA